MLIGGVASQGGVNRMAFSIVCRVVRWLLVQDQK